MTNETFLYFAYGSNLSSERIKVQNPSAVAVGPALLEDYKLDFNFHSKRWHGAPATIQAEPGSQVYGVLWKLHLDNLSSLDNQEGVKSKIYNRFQVEVRTLKDGVLSQEKSSAFSYQLHPDRCTSTGKDKQPSKVYLNVMLNGARENQLPQDYIKKLEAIEHNRYEGTVEVSLPLHVVK